VLARRVHYLTGVTTQTNRKETEMDTLTIIQTRYYGITKECDRGHWYLCEAREGTYQYFDHEPTDAEVTAYRNDLVSYYKL